MSAITRPVNVPVMEKAYRSSLTASDAGTISEGFFMVGVLNTAETYPSVGKAYAEGCTYDATGTTLLIKVIW